MRIPDSYSRIGVNAPQVSAKPPQSRAAATEDGHPAEDVHVQVSGRARELSMKADGEVDTARVDRLKASIASGDFKVDSHRIAERMVQGA